MQFLLSFWLYLILLLYWTILNQPVTRFIIEISLTIRGKGNFLLVLKAAIIFIQSLFQGIYSEELSINLPFFIGFFYIGKYHIFWLPFGKILFYRVSNYLEKYYPSYIQYRVKEIHIVPVYGIYLDFMWNKQLMLIHNKLNSISYSVRICFAFYVFKISNWYLKFPLVAIFNFKPERKIFIQEVHLCHKFLI